MAGARIRKDDVVFVTTGKERGKSGKVLRILADRDRVLIEGLNMVKRHMKARGPQQQGGILEKEASIHLSNVMPLCEKCQKPTRVRHRRLDDGTSVRACGRCGEQLDKG